jgi:hypothetical protein
LGDAHFRRNRTDQNDPSARRQFQSLRADHHAERPFGKAPRHGSPRLDSGITEFLAKPIAAKALYERVLSVVLSPRPFIQTKSYFGPDRRRSAVSSYSGPERRKGSDGGKVIPVTSLDALLQDRVKPRVPARAETPQPANPPQQVAAVGSPS